MTNKHCVELGTAPSGPRNGLTSVEACKPLQHVYPQWEIPEDDPTGDPRETWRGEMRIVHKQRARKLRKRGVPMWTLHQSGERAKYAWFVEQR